MSHSSKTAASSPLTAREAELRRGFLAALDAKESQSRELSAKLQRLKLTLDDERRAHAGAVQTLVQQHARLYRKVDELGTERAHLADENRRLRADAERLQRAHDAAQPHRAAALLDAMRASPPPHQPGSGEAAAAAAADGAALDAGLAALSLSPGGTASPPLESTTPLRSRARVLRAEAAAAARGGGEAAEEAADEVASWVRQRRTRAVLKTFRRQGGSSSPLARSSSSRPPPAASPLAAASSRANVGVRFAVPEKRVVTTPSPAPPRASPTGSGDESGSDGTPQPTRRRAGMRRRVVVGTPMPMPPSAAAPLRV